MAIFNFKKTKNLLIYIILVLFSVVGLTYGFGSKKMNLEDKIIKISNEIIDLTSEWDLFKSEEFKEIYNNPKVYMDAVLKFISEKKVNEKYKRIAALSMQNLDIKDYIVFAENVLQIREEKLISQELFHITVFPAYEWNTKIQENYKDGNVRKLLYKIKNSNSLSEDTKQYVEMILRGKAFEDITILRKVGQLPLPPQKETQ